MSERTAHTVERSATRSLTEAEWETLLNRQRVREENSIALGGVRFRKRLEQAQDGREGATVGAARKLLVAALDEVEDTLRTFAREALGEWDEELGARRGGKPGRRHTLVSWIKTCEDAFNKLDPESPEEFDYAGMAYITVKTILDHIHAQPTLFFLSTSIVTRLIDEMRYRKFQRVAPALFRYKMNNFTTDNYGHMARSLSASMKYADIDVSEFNVPKQQRTLMGTKLIEAVIEGPGMVEQIKDTSYQLSRGSVRRKDEFKIVATAETQEWMSRRNDKLEFLQPALAPMVVPPLAWGPDHRGGYRYALRTGLYYNFVRTRTDSPVIAEQGAMPKVYEAVNRMQETAFSINMPVLRLMESIEKAGGNRAGIPSTRKVEEPLKAFDTTKSDEELAEDPAFKAWKVATAKAHAAEAERAARLREFVRVLSAASSVAEERAVWFPWNLDFRGRAYPVADGLSPQGDDRQKALLRFATGKPLGENGAFYLAVHGANCLDEIPECFPAVPVEGVPDNRKVGKLSIYERRDWIEEHTLEILKVAVDPITHDWWMDADDPFMFYAFCHEWAGFYRAYRKGEGESFISHLPVAADGTCNGLQHFAAAWRDEAGAKFVNVTANERPQDVYNEVGDSVQDRLESQDPELARPTDALWLDSGLLSRSLFKRPTMTFGYGSEAYGFADQTMQYLREKTHYQTTREHFQLPGEEDGVVREVVRKAAGDLAWHIWEALDDVVVKAKLGMDWMQGCARTISRSTGNPVAWTVPLTGFKVVQPYFKADKKQIKTILCGKIIQPVHYEVSDEPNLNKQSNGISPNVIHSLDAAALMLTVTNCAREQSGMSFLMVHDSYATHAGDAGFLAKTLRESFVELYTQVDVVDDLHRQFSEQSEEELPEPPAKGTLDVAEVLESDHFFC